MKKGLKTPKRPAKPTIGEAKVSQLTEAIRKRSIIEFTNKFESHRPCGYVLDIGPKFFLLAVVCNRIWFDGFACFQVANVTDIALDPYADFVETALKSRGERLAKKPRVSVASTEDLLISAGRAFPLVTIYRDRHDPEVCQIGHVKAVRNGHVSLLEINPDATWDQEPREYRLGEITRVDFGGDLEDALHRVGGDPPRD